MARRELTARQTVNDGAPAVIRDTDWIAQIRLLVLQLNALAHTEARRSVLHAQATGPKFAVRVTRAIHSIAVRTLVTQMSALATMERLRQPTVALVMEISARKTDEISVPVARQVVMYAPQSSVT